MLLVVWVMMMMMICVIVCDVLHSLHPQVSSRQARCHLAMMCCSRFIPIQKHQTLNPKPRTQNPKPLNLTHLQLQLKVSQYWLQVLPSPVVHAHFTETQNLFENTTQNLFEKHEADMHEP